MLTKINAADAGAAHETEQRESSMSQPRSTRTGERNVVTRDDEPAGAHDVARDAVDVAALRDRHLGLRDRAVTRDLDRAAAEEVQDAHAPRPALLRDADELVTVSGSKLHFSGGNLDGRTGIYNGGNPPTISFYNADGEEVLLCQRGSWNKPPQKQ